MTAQGGLGIHFPNIYKKGVIFVKEPSPLTLGLQFRDAWTVVFLHCLLSVYDDGNCAVHRRRYGVCVCVCVSREMPCCCCFLAPGN